MTNEQLHALDRINQEMHRKRNSQYRMVSVHDLKLTISAINDLEKQNESIMKFAGEQND